jgi:hypothetical protein
MAQEMRVSTTHCVELPAVAFISEFMLTIKDKIRSVWGFVFFRIVKMLGILTS